MYYVYAIRSINKKYQYVGLTADIEQRFQRHNTGREKTTKPYAPYNLFFLTTATTRLEARLIEKYLKSGVGREFLKRLE